MNMVLSDTVVAAIQILKHSILSVSPKKLIPSVCKLCNSNELCVQNRIYKLNNNVFVVGFGKAVFGMAYEIEQLLGEHIKKGVISVPVGFTDTCGYSGLKTGSPISVIEGAKYNLPDIESFAAAMEIRELLKTLKKDDILLVLISGGGSALLPFPIPPITIEEKSEVIRLLASSGANIVELNSVRKRLSCLKGGKLANLAYPASVVSFIISDIVGDPIEFIASGPTVPNTDPSSTALNIIKKYGMYDVIPANIKRVLNEADNVEVYNQNFDHVFNNIIGNNKIALSAGKLEAEELGYKCIVLSSCIEGSISDVSACYVNLIRLLCEYKLNMHSKEDFVSIVKDAASKINQRYGQEVANSIIDHLSTLETVKRGICLIAGGEPTIKLLGTGKGGRNQELAMRIGIGLHDLKLKYSWLQNNFEVVFCSAGTDGIDGPTDAAGAISYIELVDNSFAEGLDAMYYVQNNNSYGFYTIFNRGRDLIKIGHTGTNVMDLHLIFINPN